MSTSTARTSLPYPVDVAAGVELQGDTARLVDAYRFHIEAHAPDLIARVTVQQTGYSRGRVWGYPTFDIDYRDGRRRWLSFPGGMAHSAYYACDRCTRPARWFSTRDYRGRRGERAGCPDH